MTAAETRTQLLEFAVMLTLNGEFPSTDEALAWIRARLAHRPAAAARLNRRRLSSKRLATFQGFPRTQHDFRHLTQGRTR